MVRCESGAWRGVRRLTSAGQPVGGQVAEDQEMGPDLDTTLNATQCGCRRGHARGERTCVCCTSAMLRESAGKQRRCVTNQKEKHCVDGQPRHPVVFEDIFKFKVAG